MSDNLEHVDIVTTGAVGAPGRRTFYIQARDGERVVTIRCEKQQVAAIAQYTRRALAHLPIPEGQPPRSAMALTQPIEPLFTLGAVSLEFDRSADRFALHLREMIPIDNPDDSDDRSDNESDGESGELDDPDDETDDDTDDGLAVRIVMTRAQAMAFCVHTARVVEAGRPNCDYCGLPVNPDGHFCPRMN
jgi:uncharacterized repeat protein (TIGR03847 family)